MDILTLNDTFKSLLVEEERTNYHNYHRNVKEGKNQRKILIVGGGTAGYLTALALNKHLKNVQVTVIDSSKIPSIGVGESTLTGIMSFLHKFLDIDAYDFYNEVKPTWKLGIRFEWGGDENHYFNVPYQWSNHGIGLRGSLEYFNSINWWNMQSAMMDKNLVPLIDLSGSVVSLLPYSDFSYHIDNASLIKYLRNTTTQRGIKIMDCEVADVVLAQSQDRIDYLVTKDNQQLKYDYFIDCTGFRSLLLEKAMKCRRINFDKSLFTDSALTFNISNFGEIKPYTTCKTMDAGWCWNIPQHEEDHCGYVYSSGHCNDSAAEIEVRKVFPDAKVDKVIRFQSGRHEKFWINNVIAIGNSYAFVEPLQSTAVYMICEQIKSIVDSFDVIESEPMLQDVLNKRFAFHWDKLKWFLAVHFKFNRRRNTRFWKDAREHTDISGLQSVVEMFQNGAPLTLRDSETLGLLDKSNLIPFFGKEGLDPLLLGLQVPAKLLPIVEDKEKWFGRKKMVDELLANALSHKDALELVSTVPEYLEELLENDQSWVNTKSDLNRTFLT